MDPNSADELPPSVGRGIILTGRDGRYAKLQWWSDNVMRTIFPLLYPHGQLDFIRGIPLRTQQAVMPMPQQQLIPQPSQALSQQVPSSIISIATSHHTQAQSMSHFSFGTADHSRTEQSPFTFGAEHSEPMEIDSQQSSLLSWPSTPMRTTQEPSTNALSTQRQLSEQSSNTPIFRAPTSAISRHRRTASAANLTFEAIGTPLSSRTQMPRASSLQDIANVIEGFTSFSFFIIDVL
jgi:hypothetical protein